MKKIVFGLLCVMLFLTSCSSPAKKEEVDKLSDEKNQYFYNPVDTTEMMGDPWVVWHDGFYYYTCSDGSTLTITKSEKLTTIMNEKANAAVVFVGLEYGLTEIWAPEIFFYDGYWYCYFAADINYDNRLHRMYVLKSQTEDAMGEWDYVGKLDLPEDQWAIDGTLFIHPDGRLYHIWSGWLNEAEGTSMWKQYLYITQLEDGNPTQVKSAERVIISTPEYLWEIGDLPQNEGPAILNSPKGTVYLVYSANFSGKNNYALGYLKLTGDDPMKPESWEKSPKPLVESDTEKLIYSPGHCAFTKSPDGKEDWILYHAAKAYSSGWDRSARLQKVEWEEDLPVIELTSLNTPLRMPSGEQVKRKYYQMEDGIFEADVQIREMPEAADQALVTGEGGWIELAVQVPEDGRYQFLIRHTNSLELNGNIPVTVNREQKIYAFAGRTGGEEMIGSAVFSAELKQGENIVRLQVQKGIELDELILYME